MGRPKGATNLKHRAPTLAQLEAKDRDLRFLDRIVLLRILAIDKDKHWTKRILTGELRKDALAETRHVICQIMQVKLHNTGCGVFVHNGDANLARCITCNVVYSMPDRNCPCCKYQLRRSNRAKSEKLHKIEFERVKKHEI